MKDNLAKVIDEMSRESLRLYYEQLKREIEAWPAFDKAIKEKRLVCPKPTSANS